MQFGIRKILLLIVGATVLCSLFVVGRNTFYSERRQTESVLAAIQGISNIQLHSCVDVIEEVNSSSFSVDSHPGSIIRIGGLCHYADKGRFAVSRIGNWTFRISSRIVGEAHVAATGEPVESDYFKYHMIFGVDSPYRELFPFEVNTLQDVVDHYQELVDLFESCPREAEPGTVTLEDGTTQYYYVVEEGESANPLTLSSI
jgi:hypothetical protein